MRILVFVSGFGGGAGVLVVNMVLLYVGCKVPGLLVIRGHQ